MTNHPRRTLLGTLAVALAATAVPLTGAVAADQPDPVTVARRHLVGDASGTVRILGNRAGRVGFVGTGARTGVDNPDVRPGASVAAAARAHLDRYGAVLGATGDTTYARQSVRHAVSGTDVVTYEQQVDGVPVVGGDVVVSLAPDRGLRSIQSTVSGVGSVGPATITPDEAAAVARQVVARSVGADHPQVTPEGRGLLDPEVVDVSLPSGARTVWRFEVGDGAAVRQLVLVDDHTGAVLLNSDLVERADPDRVVCDNLNVRGPETACTSGFARTETSGVSGNTDVDSAFDLSGAVSDFYQQVAGVSLTQLLGVDVGGVKKLASTVDFCTTTLTDACPYDNAFWNGQQMFYGKGWAGADDVVGHEMTHGFIDQYSKLFYWGQSGAINESMADIIGEIIDHRHPSAGDSPGDWRLGEDSPVGTIRSLSDPPAYDQPDTTTSALYTADSAYADSGGVHTDSGVGNKTAYLISQGGTFGGQTIAGIDGTDPSLTKTAKLYVDVIERLSSGAGFAALAAQLDQSCQDLLAGGTAGFTAADCTAVHQAGLATELTTTPTNAAQPADAPTSCAAGTSKRVLFDSETGDPATKLTTTGGWVRTSAAGDSNATSGTASWYAADPTTQHAYPLRTTDGIAVPTGQPTYLAFRGWNLLDYDPSGYYDGGTVEIAANGGAPVPATSLPWVNGPDKPLTSPNSGRLAFAGDSLGWVGRRVDVSSYAGSTIQPQFTLRSDSTVGFIGWYLDDITVYTCDPVPPSAVQGLRADGSLRGLTVSWQPPASNPGGVQGYRVGLSPCAIQTTLPASVTSVALVTGGQGCGGLLQVTVWVVGPPGQASPAASITVQVGTVAMSAKRSGARLTFKGAVFTSDRHRVAAALVAIQRKSSSGWVTVRTVRTGSNGLFKAAYRHRTRAYYRAACLGGPGLIGSTTASRRW